MWRSLLVGLLVTAALVTAATDEEKAVRSAQCRAMCLDEYEVGGTASHTKCLQHPACGLCWEKCGSLHSLLAGSTTSCDQLPNCVGGCRKACDFHLLSPAAGSGGSSGSSGSGDAGAQLRVEFGWSEARWTVLEPEEAGSVVFLLLARAQHRWKELVQTPEASVVLINLEPGTELRLLALTRSGLLGATEAVFEPTEPARLVLDIQQNQLTDAEESVRLDTYEIESADSWLLETVSVARDGGMVLAEISWEAQSLGPADYLVTWEVSGGGITGHLYTDITSVTLSLWPQSIYSIQVELMTAGAESPLEPVRSVPLVISTYSAAAATDAASHSKVPRAARTEPRAPAAVPERPPPQVLVLLLLAALFAALAGASVVCGGWVRYRAVTSYTAAAAGDEDSPKLLSVSSGVAPRIVPSPLEVAPIHTGKTCRHV